MQFSDRDTNINMPTMTRLWFWLCVKPVSRMRLYNSLAYQSIQKWYQTTTLDGRKVCTSKHLKDNVRPRQNSRVKDYPGLTDNRPLTTDHSSPIARLRFVAD